MTITDHKEMDFDDEDDAMERIRIAKIESNKSFFNAGVAEGKQQMKNRLRDIANKLRFGDNNLETDLIDYYEFRKELEECK
jgi:hypothetical protein